MSSSTGKTRTLKIKKIFCVDTGTVGSDDVYLGWETESDKGSTFVDEMNEDNDTSEYVINPPRTITFATYAKIRLYTDKAQNSDYLAGTIEFNLNSRSIEVGYKSFQSGSGGIYYIAFSLSDLGSDEISSTAFQSKLTVKSLVCDTKEDASDDELLLTFRIGGETYDLTKYNVKQGTHWDLYPPFTVLIPSSDILVELWELDLDIPVSDLVTIDPSNKLGSATIGHTENGDNIKSFKSGANYVLYYNVALLETKPEEPEPIKLAFNLKRIEIFESGSRTPIEWELDFRAGYVDSQDDLQNVQPHVWTEKVTSDTTYQDVAWSCEFEVDETSDKVLKIEVSGPDPNHPNDPEKQLPQATLMFAASENWGIGYGLKECKSEPDKTYSYAFYYTISDLEGVDSLPSKLSADASYVTNPNHKEIHLSDCRFVSMIAAPRRVQYSDLAALIESGYDCCYYCLPKMDWQ